jgi:hypothetical protein
MCEFLRVLLSAVDEMTNNSLLNGDSLYFLFCRLYTLGPCTSAYKLLSCKTASDFILKNRTNHTSQISKIIIKISYNTQQINAQLSIL